MNLESVKSILVTRVGGIGDTILMSPLLQNLRVFFPHAEIVLLGVRDRIRLLKGPPNADRVISCEFPAWRALYIKGATKRADVREFLREFDLVVSFTAGSRGKPAENLRSWFGPRFLHRDPRLPRDYAAHYSEYLLGVLRDLGVEPEPLLPVIGPPLGDRRAPFEPRLRGMAIVHPGSGGREKCLSLEVYLQVARAVESQLGLCVSIAIGPAEVERGVEQRVKLTHFPYRTMTDLEDAAKWVAASTLYIGNDSGMSHLAAALGVRTVTVFTSTDPCLWAPLGQSTRVVDFRKGRGKGSPPEAVLAASRELLKEAELDR